MMTLNAIQMTQFKVEKLKCIGGEDLAAPYRITLYQSIELGVLGVVPDWETDADNSATIENPKSRFATSLQKLFGRK